MNIDEEINALLDKPETIEILAYNIANRKRMCTVGYGEQTFEEKKVDTRKGRYKRKGRDHYDNKLVKGRKKK